MKRPGGLKIQMLIGLVGKGAAAVLSFGLTWLIARTYGASGVGLYSVGLTTATIGAALCLAGLEYVLVRAVAIAHGKGTMGVARAAITAAVRQTALLSIIGAAIMALSSGWVATRWLKEPEAAPFLLVMSLAIPILAFTKLASAASRGSGHITISQMIDGPIGTGSAMLGVGILYFTHRSAPLVTPAIIYCACAAMGAALGWSVLRKAMARWGSEGDYNERLLAAGLPIMVAALSNMFVDWFATFVLASSASPADAGMFRIAFQITSTLNLLNVAAESIMSPVIAREYQGGDMDRVARLVRRASLGLVALASPLLLLIAVAPGWILGLFGHEFVDAAMPLRILAFAQAINLLLGPVGMLIIMTHHERWALAYGLGGAIVSALLCFILIPAYGVMGAAIAVACSSLLRRVAAVFVARYVVGVPLFRLS